MGRALRRAGILPIALALMACSQGPPETITFDGQSLNNRPPGPRSYPDQTMAGRSEEWSKVAINGVSWTVLLKSAPERLWVNATDGRDTLVMCGGFSDIQFENDAAATVYADEVEYAMAARANGFDRIIITTLPDSVEFTDAQRAEQVAHNELLLEDPEDAFDAVVDLATIDGLDDPRDTLYYFDGTHWTAEGATLAAEAVGEVL